MTSDDNDPDDRTRATGLDIELMSVEEIDELTQTPWEEIELPEGMTSLQKGVWLGQIAFAKSIITSIQKVPEMENDSTIPRAMFHTIMHLTVETIMEGEGFEGGLDSITRIMGDRLEHRGGKMIKVVLDEFGNPVSQEDMTPIRPVKADPPKVH